MTGRRVDAGVQVAADASHDVPGYVQPDFEAAATGFVSLPVVVYQLSELRTPFKKRRISGDRKAAICVDLTYSIAVLQTLSTAPRPTDYKGYRAG